MHSERYSALACIIHQIIDIKVEGALREAPLFVRMCEIVLDLYNPFINRTKQMTAPSPLLSDVIVILAHYQASDPLYKSLRGCPSSVSATYCDRALGTPPLPVLRFSLSPLCPPLPTLSCGTNQWAISVVYLEKCIWRG